MKTLQGYFTEEDLKPVNERDVFVLKNGDYREFNRRMDKGFDKVGDLLGVVGHLFAVVLHGDYFDIDEDILLDKKQEWRHRYYFANNKGWELIRYEISNELMSRLGRRELRARL